MKRTIINILNLILSGVPFIFISMYLDYTKRSMVGYLIMILAYILLASINSAKVKKTIILGNLISYSLSYVFIINMPIEPWDGYFKPFSTTDFLMFATALSILMQLSLMKPIHKISRLIKTLVLKN
ncbi:Uncharacterised protein [[Clostridium] sordellii]|uniref:hypothetical protein n=1 Tax=Paraclostridium sordellii TaxID=1505 RepID=UPI0005E4791C|nr:hypothetical protein [Paeniclostridium sordellii]CEQ11442.1 Uncharacterised protein [[Clostridium] sordellii] [Paeniclostridium sordellii]